MDQKLSCRNKIIKNMLLILKHSSFVPCLAIFTSTAQIYHNKNAAFFQEKRIRNREPRCQRDIKSAISIHQYRVVTIKLYCFFVSDKHRHFGAIFTDAK